MTVAAFADVFGAALRGAPCTVVGLHPSVTALPVVGWRSLSSADHALIARCEGATLDVGCGPGRMSAALTESGHRALGIDLVEEAVRQARRRGAIALQRNVFDHVPGEGRWDTALLADGNIGIGGDPAALLRRLHALLAPGGRVVCDLAEPGTGIFTRIAHLECAGIRSPRFWWSLVGPEALPRLAEETGFEVLENSRILGHRIAVLVR